MTTYLMTYERRSTLVTLDTRNTSADEFGRIQREYALKCGGKESDKYAYATMMALHDATPDGIPYFWELSGPHGAYYALAIPHDATPDDVKRAKSFIRRSFDVTALRVFRLDKEAA